MKIQVQLRPLLKLQASTWLDPLLMIGLLLLAGAGLFILGSASNLNRHVVMAQASRFALGFALLWVVSHISPARLKLWTPWLYAASTMLVVLVLILGEGRGASRWLDLGIIRFQPSELLKLTTPMMLAWFLAARPLPPSWRDLGIAGVLIAVPAALIAKQPDLGTAVLVAVSGGFVIFLSGVSWKRIGLLLLILMVAAPVAWHSMHAYQRQRVQTMLNPESDPLGSGWHIMQSEIAVGSGGVLGKGFLKGTQSQLEFLPEHTTDFIFAVVGEEFGLLGVLILLTLYGFIIWRSLWIAVHGHDTYARLLGGALAMSFFIYVLVNGGMISGLLPVVGVPLPLVSYGGTSAVTLLIGFGILMSIHAHRKLMPS